MIKDEFDQLEEELGEDVGNVEEEPVPPLSPEGKTVWVGAPDAPGQAEDGISDLFNVDVDEELEDVDELVDVDFDRDILDAGEDGTLEDLVNVDREDIIGTPPAPRRKLVKPKPRYRIVRRYPPTTGMGGLSR